MFIQKKVCTIKGSAAVLMFFFVFFFNLFNLTNPNFKLDKKPGFCIECFLQTRAKPGAALQTPPSLIDSFIN